MHGLTEQPTPECVVNGTECHDGWVWAIHLLFTYFLNLFIYLFIYLSSLPSLEEFMSCDLHQQEKYQEYL